MQSTQQQQNSVWQLNDARFFQTRDYQKTGIIHVTAVIVTVRVGTHYPHVT